MCLRSDIVYQLMHVNDLSCLFLPQTEDMFDVLPMLAEVLRLRDSSMMSLELTVKNSIKL